MTLSVNCPHCNGVASCDDTELGMNANCPHCAQMFTLATPQSAAAAKAAPPKPVPVPAPPSPHKPTVSARLLRRDYLKGVRAESSYGNARTMLSLICGLVAVAGVGVIFGGFFAPATAVPGMTLAVGLVAGSVLIAGAFAAYESLIVIFDIADVMIDQRK